MYTDEFMLIRQLHLFCLAVECGQVFAAKCIRLATVLIIVQPMKCCHHCSIAANAMNDRSVHW